MRVDVGSNVNHRAELLVVRAAVQNGGQLERGGIFGNRNQTGGRQVVFLSVIFADEGSGENPLAFPGGHLRIAVKGHDFFRIGSEDSGRVSQRDAREHQDNGQAEQ